MMPSGEGIVGWKEGSGFKVPGSILNTVLLPPMPLDVANKKPVEGSNVNPSSWFAGSIPRRDLIIVQLVGLS